MTDTLDDPDHDRLANGYVDGTLSPAERGRIEADPELLARVAVLEGNRQRLLAVSDLHDAALHRDTTIASALTEYDRLRHATPPVTDRVMRWRPRTAQRVLAVAAAIVTVGIVGVTVLGTKNDEVSTSALSVVAEKTSAELSADATSPAAADAGANVAPTVTIGAIDAPATAAITISDPSGLVALADQNRIDTSANTTDDLIRTQVASPCMQDGDTFLSDVIYQGSLGVAVLTADGHARILDATCAVLLDITL